MKTLVVGLQIMFAALLISLEGCAVAPSAQMASVQDGSKLTAGGNISAFIKNKDKDDVVDVSRYPSAGLFLRYTYGKNNGNINPFDNNITYSYQRDFEGENNFHLINYEIRSSFPRGELAYAIGLEIDLTYYEHSIVPEDYAFRIYRNFVLGLGLNLYYSYNEQYCIENDFQIPLFYSRLHLAGPLFPGDISVTAGCKFPGEYPIYIEGQFGCLIYYIYGGIAVGTEFGL